MREFTHKSSLSNLAFIEFKSFESKVELDFEALNEIEQKEIINFLEDFVKTNPSFFDGYILLIMAYSLIGEQERKIEVLNRAYQKVLRLIVHKFNEWPTKMDWEIVENRSIYLVLIDKANEFWNNGFVGQAYGIYNQVLKMNIKDKSCNRYAYLGILEGLSFNEYNRMWLKNGQKTENFENWFNQNAFKHHELEYWIETSNNV